MTDKTGSKEREDVEMSRACVKAWDSSGFTSNPLDAVHPMFSAAFELGYRASLAASAVTDCARCGGSGEDPEGFYDQSRGDAGHTHDGPCRTCNGSGVAASAGSEPVAGMNEYGVRGYLAATLKCWHRLTGDEAAELVAMTQRLSGLYSPTSTPEGAGWISVDERLPNLYTEVLIYPRPTAYCCEGEVDKQGRWSYGEYETGFGHHQIACEVTHWMPLPPPPTSSADSRKGE